MNGNGSFGSNADSRQSFADQRDGQRAPSEQEAPVRPTTLGPVTSIGTSTIHVKA
jgi:hypothetical protein